MIDFLRLLCDIDATVACLPSCVSVIDPSHFKVFTRVVPLLSTVMRGGVQPAKREEDWGWGLLGCVVTNSFTLLFQLPIPCACVCVSCVCVRECAYLVCVCVNACVRAYVCVSCQKYIKQQIQH